MQCNWTPGGARSQFGCFHIVFSVIRNLGHDKKPTVRVKRKKLIAWCIIHAISQLICTNKKGVQASSNEAVEQDEDNEEDSSNVSDSESDEAETDLEDESSDYYYSDCSDEDWQ